MNSKASEPFSQSGEDTHEPRAAKMALDGGVDMKIHAREMEKPDKLKAIAEKIRAAMD